MKQKLKSKFHYILCAGGTGGHLFPALAVAEILLEANQKVTLFTDARSLPYLKANPLSKLEVKCLTSRSFSGNVIQKLISLCFLSIGLIQALYFILKSSPHKLIGFGGYPAFPGMMAAILCRKPLILHEQNSILGRVNRFFSKFAEKIAISYPIAFFKSHNNIPPALEAKLIYTGNPIRAAFLQLKNQTQISSRGKLQLFIFGGSQGASIFAKTLPQQILNLPKQIQKRLHLIQQARIEDIEPLKALYTKANISAEIKSFFANMHEIIPHSHLVIARAGASSIAELSATQTPAIYIPLPTSKDQHQEYNARFVSESLKISWRVEQKEIGGPAFLSLLTKFFTQDLETQKILSNLNAYQHFQAFEKMLL